MPQPNETLDFPAYQPPRPKRRLEKSLLILALVLPAVLIAGIVVLPIVEGVAAKLRPRPRRHPTSQLVALLGSACASFRVLTGQYPWPKPDSVTATTEIKGSDVYIELCGLPGAKINTSRHLIAEVDKHLLKNGALVDTWGHEIMFRVDPATMKPVIWSCGRDGKDDTNDGVSPDPVKFPKTYYWFGTGRKSDDISRR